MASQVSRDLAGLVPESYDDFRSVAFWDGFFQKRQRKAFEWYGEWPSLRPVAGALCAGNCSVLVVGCGNSELSAQMYDDGIHCITNIDFSKVVIKEMMAKNLRQRPSMKWQVMDMTAMKFPDSSFDIVMDKGGLDALMGEDNEGATETASKFLQEVARVLKSEKGVYLCVTLAQSHVLDMMFTSFSAGWDATLYKLIPPADMARAPLQPYLVVLQRTGSSQSAGTSATPDDVRLAFKAEASARTPDSEHMAEVLQAVAKQNRLRADARAGHVPATPPGYFDRLRPGQRTVLQLPLCPPAPLASGVSAPTAASGAPSLAGLSVSGSNEGGAAPLSTAAPATTEGLPPPYRGRFTVAVCDVEHAPGSALQCAVFLVPQGRELEWLFASEEGQWQVAGSCNAHRVIITAINRTVPSSSAGRPDPSNGLWREFADLEDVQRALSPLVVPLAPPEVRNVPRAIPFMSMGGGIGQRHVLETAASPLSGAIAVEDIELHDSDDGEGNEAPPHRASGRRRSSTALPHRPPGRWVRRLVFLANQGRVQSEVRLLPSSATSSSGTPAQSAGAPPSAVAPGHSGRTLDQGHLSCNYQAALVAGLCITAPQLQRLKKQPQRGSAHAGSGPRCLLVGLGAGTLAVYLQQCFGMQVLAVELDEVVVQLARRHFGITDGPDSGLSIEVADGVAVVARLAGGSGRPSAAPQPSLEAATASAAGPSPLTVFSLAVDVLIVDADCGDASLAMSCPPPAFLEDVFLANAAKLLGKEGLLALNCVSRAQGTYQAAIRALQAHFAHVYELDVDEDVNRLLFATQQPAAHGFGELSVGAPPSKKAAATAAAAVAGLAACSLSPKFVQTLASHVRCLRRLSVTS